MAELLFLNNISNVFTGNASFVVNPNHLMTYMEFDISGTTLYLDLYKYDLNNPSSYDHVQAEIELSFISYVNSAFKGVDTEYTYYITTYFNGIGSFIPTDYIKVNNLTLSYTYDSIPFINFNPESSSYYKTYVCVVKDYVYVFYVASNGESNVGNIEVFNKNFEAITSQTLFSTSSYFFPFVYSHNITDNTLLIIDNSSFKIYEYNYETSINRSFDLPENTYYVFKEGSNYYLLKFSGEWIEGNYYYTFYIDKYTVSNNTLQFVETLYNTSSIDSIRYYNVFYGYTKDAHIVYVRDIQTIFAFYNGTLYTLSNFDSGSSYVPFISSCNELFLIFREISI